MIKYDTLKNKWQEWIKYPEDTQTKFDTVSFDAKSNLVYIINSDQMIKINPNTSTSEIQKLNCIHPSFQSSLCVHGELYLFGASASQTLLPLDISTELGIYREYGKKHSKHTRTHSSCYHKSKNCIYALRLSIEEDPNHYKYGEYHGDIWKLDLNHHEPSWNKLGLLFSNGLPRAEAEHDAIAVITNDEKYMLIIVHRKIFVWNFENIAVIMSKVQVPKNFRNGAYRGCISDDRTANNLVICALGRKYTTKHVNIAIDLLELISGYLRTEWLHLIARQPKNNHCKIRVSTIVDALALKRRIFCPIPLD